MFSKLPGWLQAIVIAALAAVVPLLPGLLAEPSPTITLRELARVALSSACAVGAMYLRANPFFNSAPKSDQRGFVRVELATLSAVLAAFLLAACAMFGPDPRDPAALAREARVGSEKACAAYQAAVAADLIKPDPRAETSCRAVQGVCSELIPLPAAPTE
jgi:hypothetical protein